MTTKPPSYKETLRYHCLSHTQLDVECHEDIPHPISKKMGEWRNILLGVDKGDIATIENDKNTDNEGKCRQLLEFWKKRLGHRATYALLVERFIESRRADLADEVCLDFKKQVSQQQEEQDDATVSNLSTTVCQSFPSRAQLAEDTPESNEHSNNRDVTAVHHHRPPLLPPPAVENIGATSTNTSTKLSSTRNEFLTTPTSQQEQNSERRLSDMALPTNRPSQSQSGIPRQPAVGNIPQHCKQMMDMMDTQNKTIAALTSLLDKEKDEKIQMVCTHLKTMSESMKTIGECLSQKEARINDLEEQVRQMSLRLNEEVLQEKVLQKKLDQSLAEFEVEKTAKEEQIAALKRDLEKANSEIEKMKKDDVFHDAEA